jgi:deoxyribodipyrimidine photolyase-related protein
MSASSLRVVLGDQLAPTLSALRDGDPVRDVVLMMEVAEETTYVPHHKKKIAFVLAAMRAFAEELRALGWQVDYVALNDPRNEGSFTRELARAVERHAPAQIVSTRGSEHRVAEVQANWAEMFSVPVEVRADGRFICTPSEFAAWAEGRKQLRMEYFYREMRRKTNLLMDGDRSCPNAWCSWPLRGHRVRIR